MNNLGFLMVARNQHGELIRGTSDDFRPDQYFFHVVDPRTRERVRVLRTQLKAVFFVKSLTGDPHHTEKKSFSGIIRLLIWPLSTSLKSMFQTQSLQRQISSPLYQKIRLNS